MVNEPTAPASPRTPQSKAELMERIHRSRAALEGLISTLSEAQMIAPGGTDGWSVKDHLAHLTAWYGSLLALLEGRPRHEPMAMDKANYDAADTDGINQHIYQRNRDRSLADVLADYRRADQQVLGALDRLIDEDIFLPYSHFQPDAPPYNPNPVIGWIIGNTCEHVDEHIGWIQALIDSEAVRRPAGG
jgi:hypothetical protein